jgi:hypothetical protein
VCTDGAEAQGSNGACVLDYRVAGSQGTRLTFVWQSMLRGYMRFKLRQRLAALVAGAGGRAPDLLVASIGVSPTLILTLTLTLFNPNPDPLTLTLY